MGQATWRHTVTAAMLAVAACSGCFATNKQIIVPPPDGTVPRELVKQALPPYVIEPPDELYVEVMLPPVDEKKSPYSTSLPPQPISGRFLVQPDGTVSLGIYGTVMVSGLTVDQARDRVREFIAKVRKYEPDSLQVTVTVAAFNSKVYYVITDGAGFGEQVYAFPTVGSETVLDALARVGGIPAVGSKRHIWIARRSPHGGPEQILPVNWNAVAMEGITQTNYQVLPGDRLYVQAQKLITVDNALAKIFAPVERVFGVILLGSTTVNNVNGRFGNQNQNQN